MITKYLEAIPIFGSIILSKKIRELEAKLNTVIVQQEFVVASYEARLNGIYKNLLKLSEQLSEKENAIILSLYNKNSHEK